MDLATLATVLVTSFLVPLAAKVGFNLTGDQTSIVTGFVVTSVTTFVHYFETKFKINKAASLGTTAKILFIGLFAGALLSSLSACASLGLTSPTTTQQQIAYGYSGVTAALNTLAQATSQGIVSSSDATQANAAILAVKTSLDTASQEVSSNQPQAVQILEGATQALATVSAFLACKQAKGASCQL